MSTVLLVAILPLCLPLVTSIRAESPPPVRQLPRFEAVDVYMDSHAKPLAAYQFKLTVDANAAEIVGVEGGEHPAFHDAPYYDPAALAHQRIIVAAFSTGPSLPTGKTRVARLHMRVMTQDEPHYSIRLQTAGDSGGRQIDGAISFGEGVTR